MRLAGWLLAASVAATIGGCAVKVEDEGRAPDISKGDPGELPRVEIEPANVEISSDTQQIVTPEVKVTPMEGNDSTADRDSTR
jgi:hypothetical protein